MLGIVMITVLGSSLSTALVVHGRINGSAINFLSCDPKDSKCDDAKENENLGEYQPTSLKG